MCLKFWTELKKIVNSFIGLIKRELHLHLLATIWNYNKKMKKKSNFFVIKTQIYNEKKTLFRIALFKKDN